MSQIYNSEEIVKVGPSQLRRDGLTIIKSAIDAADPYDAVLRMIQRDGSNITVAGHQYDLQRWKRVIVIGAGKATQRIGLALEELIGDRVSTGLIVLKRGEENRLKQLPVMYASHPIPDQDSLQAGQKLLALAVGASQGDLVISAFTGGSSALAILPVEGISLAEKQVVNRLLLDCGATIFEINAVRKHISQIKGGRLAEVVFPADLICLTVSDVVGDQLDYITDLTVPDTSTYQDAWHTLEKYRLWGIIPASVREHLSKGAEIETPKHFFHSYQPVLLVPGNAAFQGALSCCQSLGYQVQPVEKELEGDSLQEARAMVNTAQGWLRSAQSPGKLALIASGETTVTIEGEPGKGGPNQEFALGAALEIVDIPEIVVASIDMDGTDEPTNAAGAIVDGETVQRGTLSGMDAYYSLKFHNAYEFLKIQPRFGAYGANWDQCERFDVNFDRLQEMIIFIPV